MKYPHGKLTDEQVRTLYFIVPPFGILLLFGHEGTVRLLRQRLEVARDGGVLHVIGWPDGTTVTYHILDRNEPINPDKLRATYRASAALHCVAEAGDLQ